MNAKNLSLSVLILIGSFSELIVFNEEVLLALCFISFVFFAYNYMSETIAAIFVDRAVKFEADILVAFEAKHSAISSYANDLLLSKMLFQGLTFFEVAVRQYNEFLFTSACSSRRLTIISMTIAKFNDAVLAERKFKSSSQKTNVQSSVYPLIFSLAKKDFKFLG